MLTAARKYLSWGLLFLTLTGVTLLLLGEASFSSLVSALDRKTFPWLLAGLLCMVLFFLCEAQNIRTALNIFGQSVSFSSCLSYSFTGFFFSSITPSSSGGQPMQLWVMNQAGHRLAPSGLALLTVFLSYQTVSIFLGLAGFLWWRIPLQDIHPLWWVCFLVGSLLSLSLLAGLLLCLFSPALAPRLGRALLPPLPLLMPHRVPKLTQWASRQWADLRQCARQYPYHKKELGRMVLTAFLQLTAYHSVPFWVGLAFGLPLPSLPEVIGLQAALYLSVSSLPLPGGIGTSEGSALLLYPFLFPPSLLSGGVLLSRWVSFYLPLLVTGSFLALRFILSKKKNTSVSCPP